MMKEFVIVYNRSSGVAHVRCFNNPELALEWRMALEADTEPNEEVAHISSSSLESLQISHSRYFMQDDVTFEAVDSSPELPKFMAV